MCCALSAAAAFLKDLQMCAAIWGVLYEAEREFDTTWGELQSPCVGLVLIDAAENGRHSHYAEGAIVRFLLAQPLILPMNALTVNEMEPGLFSMTLRRAALEIDATTWEDWGDLLERFEKQFKAGIHQSDLRFIRQAVDWLRRGGQIKGGVCSELRNNLDT